MLPPDNPWPVLIVLLCVAIGFGLQWYGSKKNSALAVMLLSLGLGIGCYAWSQSVETPTKVITARLHEMTAAFQNQDVAKTKSYFSQQAALPVELDTVISMVRVHGEIRLSDISVILKQQNSLATCHFRANGTFSPATGGAQQYLPTRWELDWQREGNEWKIIAVRRLHMMNGKEVNVITGM